MADWKTLNNRERRAAAIRQIAGENLSPQAKAALDHSEAVTEASMFMRQMREEARLTQAQLGARLGVTQARISELERGNAPEGMSYALLRRAAKACGFYSWPLAPVEATADVGQKEHEPTTVEVMEFAKVPGVVIKPVPLGFGPRKKTGGIPQRIAAGEPDYRIVVVPTEQAATRHVEVNLSDTVKSVSDLLSSSPAFKVLDSK